ncbi:hypothetical protein FYL99_RS19965, partial [Escherichia coli]|nr:hypothetical protein [Escherichia coli]
MRDFAHAQNHPSDGRPHANSNTPRRLPAATGVFSSGQSRCRFAYKVAVALFIVIYLLLPVFFVVTHNGIYFTMGRFPALPENPAVVLRIEPLRVS